MPPKNPIPAWRRISPESPREGELVQTCIHDRYGIRHMQPLRRQGTAWLFEDGGMYVCYTPTHWRPCA